MLFRPSYVFKYKSLCSKVDLDRCKDIIENFRLYLSCTSELNDPMESGTAYIQLAFAGATLYSIAEMASPPVSEELKNFRVLSLSEQCNNPQMWAHYANNYNGICFAFNTKSALRDVEPVIYTNHRFIAHEDEVDDLSRYIHDSLLFKQKDWSNEYEWRIIRKQEEKFLSFEKHDLCGVIISHNPNQQDNRPFIKEFIALCKEKEIPIWQTHPTNTTVHIVPLNFEVELGSPLHTQIQEAYDRCGQRPIFI